MKSEQPDLTSGLRDPWIRAALASAFCLRAGLVFWFPDPSPVNDEIDYWRLAEGLASGQGYASNFRPPLHPAFMSIFAGMGQGAWPVRAAQAVIGALCVLPIAWLAARLGGRGAARVAAFGLALDPVLIGFSHLLWSETLYIALLLGGLVALVFDRERARPLHWALAGVCFGLGALARPQLLTFLPLLLPWAWLNARGRGAAHLAPTAAAFVALTLATCAVVLPWSLRNARETGAFFLIDTNGPYNVLVSTEPGAYQVDKDDRWSPAWAAIGNMHYTVAAERDPAAAQSLALRRARRQIAAAPGRYASKSLWEAGHLFTLDNFVLRHLRKRLVRRAHSPCPDHTSDALVRAVDRGAVRGGCGGALAATGVAGARFRAIGAAARRRPLRADLLIVSLCGSPAAALPAGGSLVVDPARGCARAAARRSPRSRLLRGGGRLADRRLGARSASAGRPVDRRRSRAPLRARDRPMRLLCLLACLAAGAGWLGCGAAPKPPNIVMVVFDTTRADRFSAYGYAAAKTPHFDALAREGVLFENAFSTSSWTVPSHASLFTGLYPMAHGANQVTQYLGDEHETLAERLAGAGYQTVAFSNNVWVGERANLTQGFERVAEAWRMPGPGQAARTNKAIELWLERRTDERPFFLFVNYIEPHWPYEAPESDQARFVPSDVSAAERKAANFAVIRWYLDRESIAPDSLSLRHRLYDAEISTVDQALGNLMRLLRDHELEESSLVVALADHGENLGDNGHQGHSFVLYDSTLRVPLVIRAPGRAATGTRRSDPVQVTDVYATVAAAVGLPGAGVGQDLLAGELPDDRPVLGEYYYPKQFIRYFPEDERDGPILAPYLRLIRSLRVGPHKLIWGSDGRHELYDVASDPAETQDLLAAEPDIAKALERKLDLLLREHGRDAHGDAAPAGELDPDVERSLRELGYVR